MSSLFSKRRSEKLASPCEELGLETKKKLTDYFNKTIRPLMDKDQLNNYCKYCNKFFSSNYNRHYSTKIHKKNKQKYIKK